MHARVPTLFIVILFYLVLVPQGHARSIVLYGPRGGQVEEYSKDLLLHVKPGDVLDMGDGHKFKILKALGHGNTNMIFETNDHQALRVPLSRGKFRHDLLYREWIEDYYKGAKVLDGSDIPIPHLNFTASDASGRYLIGEKIQGASFSIGEFIEKSPKDLGLTPAEYKKIDGELTAFARKTWQFKYIQDAHDGQVVWTKKGWVLMDFASSFELAEPGDAEAASRTIFNDSLMTDYHTSGQGAQRLKELSQATLDERRDRLNKAPTMCATKFAAIKAAAGQ